MDMTAHWGISLYRAKRHKTNDEKLGICTFLIYVIKTIDTLQGHCVFSTHSDFKLSLRSILFP